jgi:hypothetical protein
VALPHLYHFLKSTSRRTELRGHHVAGDCALLDTHAVDPERRLHLLVKTVFAHMWDFVQHPDDSCKVIGEITAVMFHCLNIILRLPSGRNKVHRNEKMGSSFSPIEPVIDNVEKRST